MPGPESCDASENQTLLDTNAQSGIIFDVKRYAIHDGPGIRTTVFLKGCPLRCRWCHNPESLLGRPEHSLRHDRCSGCNRCIETCQQGAISRAGDEWSLDPSKCVFCGACVDACPTGRREILGRRVSVPELIDEIERDVIFFDQSGGGVTFSGGEPLVQAAFLGELLQQCKARELHTVLDTTCHAPWEVVEPISRHVDLFLCDVKHLDSAAHERFTGVPNELILQNIRRLDRLGRQIIVRIPIIPGVNDDPQNIAATGEFITSLAGVQRVNLLPLHNTAKAKMTRLAEGHELLQVGTPSAERLQSIAEHFDKCGLVVKIGG